MKSDPYLTVAEDIEYLQEQWKDGAEGAERRRGSAILRRLLVEGVIQKAWREHGFSQQPTVIGPDLSALVGERPEAVHLAVAGGGLVSGVYIGCAVLSDEKDLKPKVGEGEDAGSLMEKQWRLGDYIESASVIVDGEVIKRREIIKYFANTLGGVHLQLSSRMRRREEDLVRRIERIDQIIKMTIVGEDALYHEILSIGQAIGNSSDLAELVEKIRQKNR